MVQKADLMVHACKSFLRKLEDLNSNSHIREKSQVLSKMATGGRIALCWHGHSRAVAMKGIGWGTGVTVVDSGEGEWLHFNCAREFDLEVGLKVEVRGVPTAVLPLSGEGRGYG